ncbi:Ig-like domain-containing protein [Pseudooctadecabacter sp.]|uniref:Ig-like domain-containing protein n=1 Tax=Pseudooctadecabacter sp. TaxID=1966338 RepID=UPI0035C79871
MSAINFVVRDGAGNISRGTAGESAASSSIVVGAGSDISLNLSQGQIVSYTRAGQALQITLVDGRVITIEGYFTSDGVASNELFLSSGGTLTEVNLTQGAGADYFANYIADDGIGKFAINEDLYFMRGSDVLRADVGGADDEVGMLGAAIGGIGPLFGWGGAAAAAGAAVIGGGGGGGDGGPAAPVVDVTSGTVESDDTSVNEEDHADGVVIDGTGTPGGDVEVTIDGTTETTTVSEEGDWTVTFDTEDITEGEYTTDVTVTITTEGGSTTVTETLVVDTVIGAEMDATGGADGIINAAEYDGGVTLTGTVTGGDSVVVTIGGVDYDATVTGGTWSLDVGTSVLGEGEYDMDVTITATDAAGNSSVSSGTVVVDTVTSVTVETATIGGSDNVVNGVEQPGGVTLTGTAQPGASVEVTFGTVTQTVIATSGGTWSATYAGGDVPTGELDVPVSVTATDGAGNTATATSSVTVDTFVNELEMTTNSSGGSDGVVNFNESGEAITMAGTVEAGSTVSVSLHGVVMAATVDANGNWSVTYPGGTLPGGEYETSVVVTATDAAGNSSSISEAVTVDTVAGDLALSSQPIEIDDVVNAVEHADGVIINGTATPGLVVTVGLGDATLNVLAGDDGTWSVNFPAGVIPEGTYEADITASITDAAGNYKEVSDTVQIDTEVVPFNFSADAVEGDNVINAAEAADGVTLTGQVEAGSQVVVEFGGESVTVMAGSNGQWSANFSGAGFADTEGMATMTATATDPAGNVAVITDTVEIDTYVNNLTTADPVEGDNIVNRAEAEDGVTLTGTVEAESTVMVTFASSGGTITREATVDAAGNWSVTYDGAEIPAGEYDANITIAATDQHGNTDSITDTFRVDTVATDAPTIESVTINEDGVRALEINEIDNDFTVSSISDSGEVTLEGNQDGGFDLGDTQLFTFNPELPSGTHLVVNEIDGAGNQNATYVVMEETRTDVVNLDGLEGFDVGAIDLSYATDAEVTLDLSALEGLSDNDNNLIIHGGSDDSVNIAGATDSGTTTTIEGKTYDVYTMGDDAQIFIEEDINVSTI